MEKQRKPQQKIRINRYLAMCGLGSRRKCDEIVSAGQIRINGAEIAQLGSRVDPETDTVTYNGEVVKPQERPVYILLNKPLRTVTTVSDEKHRKTVVNLVNISERIFPVGRLDYNTTGALLLTNDGDLAYYLAHPRFEVRKIYRVLLNNRIRPIDLHHFRKGIDLDGKTTAPCRAEELRILDNASYLEVELHEGRNRQIRRMFDVLGYRVIELHRLEFAGLRVQDLKEGEWRLLSPEEVKSLKSSVMNFKGKVGKKDNRE